MSSPGWCRLRYLAVARKWGGSNSRISACIGCASRSLAGVGNAVCARRHLGAAGYAAGLGELPSPGSTALRSEGRSAAVAVAVAVASAGEHGACAAGSGAVCSCRGLAAGALHGAHAASLGTAPRPAWCVWGGWNAPPEVHPVRISASKKTHARAYELLARATWTAPNETPRLSASWSW